MDCSLETRVKAVLGMTRACDVQEFLAASRALARTYIFVPYTGKSSGMTTLACTTCLCWHGFDEVARLRCEADQIEARIAADADRLAIEQRWRRAVEACAP